ncbi:MAG: AAA family ATPase [Patescibacteria group bacterium]
MGYSDNDITASPTGQTPMVIWFFGLPGTGKSTLAQRLSSLARIPFVDLDALLTEGEKSALLNHAFTVEMRLNKLTRAVALIQSTLSKNLLATTADSLPDYRSRRYVAQSLGDRVRLVLVRTPRELHTKRLEERKNHFFTSDLLDEYEKAHWDANIIIPHTVFENTEGPSVVFDKKLLDVYDSIVHS